ncbi:MAG: ArsA-related P-loop ATPase [Actinomycetota bacterium]
MDGGEIGELLDGHDVVVCCGSGGVGKTTTAAAIALEGARRGRRTVVVTIDPARRLADAFGLADGLSAEPQRVVVSHGIGESSNGDGQLWAMMLDPSVTFDGLVEKYADDADQIERITTNRFYRNMASAMSGTQEYMAAETLHALHHDDRFDLVIVDTPPSRSALDFLEAPGVLSRFLDHRVFKLAMLPTRSGLKIFGTAAQPIFRAIGRVVGSDVLTDALAFFQAFAGMENGFRDRADDVVALLRADRTAFAVVASPRTDTIAEATWFARQLRDQGVGVAVAIVNRLHPDVGTGDGDGSGDDGSADDDDALDGSSDDADAVLRRLRGNRAQLAEIRRAELDALGPLHDLVAPAPLVTVPLLGDDVHELAGLDRIRSELVA